jgi:hypothetical protein
MIASASESVLASFWPEQGQDLRSSLEAADGRGVTVVTMQFGDDCLSVGNVFQHIMVPTVYERHGSEFFLVVDDSEGMFMVQERHRDWEGYFTSNPAVVKVLTNYIRHDIYANRLIKAEGEAVFEKWGRDLEKLLKVP